MKSTRPENFRLWIDGLRSGEFAQGRSALRLDEAFCCLGVACEVAVRNGLELDVVSEDYKTDSGDTRTEWSYDGNTACLPRAVSDWLGVDRGNIFVRDEEADLDRTAVNVNDSQRWDFGKIADALEKAYL